jgi:DNA (cytosine-5)-methyltransferase 1
MTHGSLFSGIGGFDLAAEWMGWENKFHCEWNKFGQRVLNYYWPNAELFTDITKSDFTKYANQIDILTGGFPCQPYSAAGKRLGKEDERHLWPQMCRAIQEIAPRYVVGENVRGLTNWNGGMVFDEVCADLENLGYQVAPFIIPASAVNAPHQRERIWFVAYSFSNGRQKQSCDMGTTKNKKRKGRNSFAIGIDNNGTNGNATNTNCNGFNQCDSEYEKHSGKTGFNALYDVNKNDERRDVANTQCSDLENEWNEQRILGKENSRQSSTRFKYANIPSNWSAFPTFEPTICRGNDGISTELDGITFSKWRIESIKAYGNAICPQVVLQIFKGIEAYESKR